MSDTEQDDREPWWHSAEGIVEQGIAFRSLPPEVQQEYVRQLFYYHHWAMEAARLFRSKKHTLEE